MKPESLETVNDYFAALYQHAKSTTCFYGSWLEVACLCGALMQKKIILVVCSNWLYRNGGRAVRYYAGRFVRESKFSERGTIKISMSRFECCSFLQY